MQTANWLIANNTLNSLTRELGRECKRVVALPDSDEPE
jgi:hypothetical protein